MRKRDPVREVKRILKLHEKKKKLEEKLNELWKERDNKDYKQGLIFIGCIALFLFGIFGGLSLLVEDALFKILGGYLLGISSGMAILFVARAKMEALEDQIKEIDKEIESVEKKVEEIKKEIE